MKSDNYLNRDAPANYTNNNTTSTNPKIFIGITRVRVRVRIHFNIRHAPVNMKLGDVKKHM